MNLLFSWPRAARGATATALALVLGAAAPSLARTPSTFLDSIAGLRSAQPTGFVHCPQFFVGGKPPPVPRRAQQRQLCYEAFAVLHSGETRTPVYVAQRLNRQVLEGADEKRSNKFFADARLPRGERAELDDYKRSGYSRGHMAPAADMSTPTAMAQSFSLANMVPQDPRQNGGPWARIEQDTRRYVLRARGDVYVITGPVFTAESPAIGASKVRVPAYLFKLVYDASTQRAWAHWQANREGERAGPPISYQELVKRTGVEFLPQVEPQH